MKGVAMDTVERLGKDHQVVYSKLDSLAQALEQGPGGEAVVQELARFFEEEVAMHFGVEEKALFPELSRITWLRSGPVAVMLSEHEVLKKLLSKYQETVKTGAYRRPDGEKEFQALAISLVENLRAHAEKEDQVLFPMAQRFLASQQREEVDRAADLVYNPR